MKRYDEHYKNDEISPQLIKEHVLNELISFGVAPRVAANIYDSIKYLRRAGKKKNEDTYKDINKACHYIYRALTGRFPWEEKDV